MLRGTLTAHKVDLSQPPKMVCRVFAHPEELRGARHLEQIKVTGIKPQAEAGMVTERGCPQGQ